jgi:hypothetical protein
MKYIRHRGNAKINDNATRIHNAMTIMRKIPTSRIARETISVLLTFFPVHFELKVGDITLQVSMLGLYNVTVVLSPPCAVVSRR